MARPIEIATMGYIFYEEILTPDGNVSGPFLGATASYGSIALARAGFPTGLVSNVGLDTPPELLDIFRRAGVDMTGLNERPGCSITRDLLRYYADGTKEIEYLTRAPHILPEDVPVRYMESMRVLMLSLVDYEVEIETIRHIRAKRPSVVVACDLGGAGGAHSTPGLREKYIVHENGRRQRELMDLIDIGKMSLEDYACITGRQENEPRTAAADILDMGLKIVIVTMGEDGSYALDRRGNEWRIPAVTPYGGVVDTTGAGDIYIAIFAAEFTAHGNIEQAMYLASATSSLIIEKTGGVTLERIPDRATIDARLERFLSEQPVRR